MATQEKKGFAAKHPENTIPDASIKAGIEKRLKGKDQLPCAVAFAVAKETARFPKEVGQTADLMGIRLSKCQLGLFGYSPEKKIVKPAERIEPSLNEAITRALTKGRLSCESAWRIADTLRVSKMAVSAACEAMNIKITACQLGAF
ncbi:MAG: hypothetical protein JRI76_00360 [Deltaproteobacteria bacterium]|nr:hypothetical protein [Deltaproteobacteria bacterium]MBW2040460.1 hypothetical protein [Deltaproteobacteria bacterium]MBW2131885.1 hypothetical protein [Deltaproteobacteria bacterium]